MRSCFTRTYAQLLTDADVTHACCAQIAVRLGNAKTEMDKRDVPGFFDGVVVNDDLDAAFGRLKGARRARVCVCVMLRACC